MRWLEYKEKAKAENLISYEELHLKYKRLLARPLECHFCGLEKKLDLANKSGKYLDRKTDWFYLCRKCHYNYDKVADKARDKISQKLRGNKNGVGNKGRAKGSYTDSQRKAISDRMSGRTVSEETKEKIRMSMVGKNVGKKRTMEVRIKIGIASSLRRHSEETKLKMSKSAKNRNQSRNKVKAAEMMNNL